MRPNLVSKLSLFALTCLVQVSLFAQSPQVAEATGMRSNNKIYVVLAVCLTILGGLFFYLFSVDRKISKLEQ